MYQTYIATRYVGADLPALRPREIDDTPSIQSEQRPVDSLSLDVLRQNEEGPG